MEDNSFELTALEARWYLYRLFQVLFGGEPTEEVWGMVADASTDEALALFDIEEGAYREAVSAWKVARGSIGAGRSGALRLGDLASEYTRLMLGPGRLAAEPWESQYLTHDRAIFQEHTLRVRNVYRAQGLLPAEYPRVADDHIALECGFLAALAERAKTACERAEALAFSEALEASRSFLTDHLLRWASSYADKMAGAERAVFYPALARLLAEFAVFDRMLIEELLATELSNSD